MEWLAILAIGIVIGMVLGTIVGFVATAILFVGTGAKHD